MRERFQRGIKGILCKYWDYTMQYDSAGCRMLEQAVTRCDCRNCNWFERRENNEQMVPR